MTRMQATAILKASWTTRVHASSLKERASHGHAVIPARNPIVRKSNEQRTTGLRQHAKRMLPKPRSVWHWIYRGVWAVLQEMRYRNCVLEGDES